MQTLPIIIIVATIACLLGVVATVVFIHYTSKMAKLQADNDALKDDFVKSQLRLSGVERGLYDTSKALATDTDNKIALVDTKINELATTTVEALTAIQQTAATKNNG